MGLLQVSAYQLVSYYLTGNCTKQRMGAMTSECTIKEWKEAGEKSNHDSWYFKTTSTATGNDLTRACIKDKEGVRTTKPFVTWEFSSVIMRRLEEIIRCIIFKEALHKIVPMMDW